MTTFTLPDLMEVAESALRSYGRISNNVIPMTLLSKDRETILVCIYPIMKCLPPPVMTQIMALWYEPQAVAFIGPGIAMHFDAVDPEELQRIYRQLVSGEKQPSDLMAETCRMRDMVIIFGEADGEEDRVYPYWVEGTAPTRSFVPKENDQDEQHTNIQRLRNPEHTEELAQDIVHFLEHDAPMVVFGEIPLEVFRERIEQVEANPVETLKDWIGKVFDGLPSRTPRSPQQGDQSHERDQPHA